jgi:hypothetical protein
MHTVSDFDWFLGCGSYILRAIAHILQLMVESGWFSKKGANGSGVLPLNADPRVQAAREVCPCLKRRNWLWRIRP